MSDVNEILKSVREVLDPKDDNILFYIVHVTEHDNKIECLNPKLVSEQDFLEAKRLCPLSKKN